MLPEPTAALAGCRGGRGGRAAAASARTPSAPSRCSFPHAPRESPQRRAGKRSAKANRLKSQRKTRARRGAGRETVAGEDVVERPGVVQGRRAPPRERAHRAPQLVSPSFSSSSACCGVRPRGSRVEVLARAVELPGVIELLEEEVRVDHPPTRQARCGCCKHGGRKPQPVDHDAALRLPHRVEKSGVAKSATARARDTHAGPAWAIQHVGDGLDRRSAGRPPRLPPQRGVHGNNPRR